MASAAQPASPAEPTPSARASVSEGANWRHAKERGTQQARACSLFRDAGENEGLTPPFGRPWRFAVPANYARRGALQARSSVPSPSPPAVGGEGWPKAGV